MVYIMGRHLSQFVRLICYLMCLCIVTLNKIHFHCNKTIKYIYYKHVVIVPVYRFDFGSYLVAKC